MTEYNIKYWEKVIGEDTCLSFKPVVYIIPDLYLLEFIRKNNYNLFCEVVDSDSEYDNKKFSVTVNKKYNHSCPENIDANISVYLVTINTKALEKLPEKGKIKFYGLYEPLAQQK
jgi:hypothetical protein